MARRILYCIVFLLHYSHVHSVLEGLYCGRDDCYELLELTREASRNEVMKSYRKLARKWHPDRHKGEDAKKEAAIMFQKIANAYEILKDSETRDDYDYMLDHPEEYYSHYYRYYQRRVTPKIDVRIVIAVTLTIISGIQYWSAWNNYNSAIAYLSTVPKYRLQAQDIAKSEGLLGDKRKRDRSKTKEELRLEEEAILRQVIESKMDIRGGHQKPTLYDVLWVQLIFCPYYLLRYVAWYLRWLWKFSLCGNEYGYEEKSYIIRRSMKMSQGQWNAQEDHVLEEFHRLELWKKDNFAKWKKEKEDEMKEEMAVNTRFKKYRRYMKKGGPGQMSFGPE